MDWNQPIDIYCERLSPEFWAEPVNAITNLAFVAAGVWAFLYARTRSALDPAIIGLSILSTSVGVGSFLFHTFAVQWAGIADVGSIALFMIAGMLIGLRRLFGISWLWATIAAIGFAVVIFVGPERFNIEIPALGEGNRYLPAVIALGMISGALALKRREASRPIASAACILSLSLIFRTIDAGICEAFPLGTHFLWHILNGCVLSLIMYSIIRYQIHSGD